MAQFGWTKNRIIVIFNRGGDSLKKFFSLLLSAIVLICVGIFMIAMPDAFLGIVVIVFSLFLALDGLKSIYLIFKTKIGSRGFKWTMGIKALINIAIGVTAIVLAAQDPATVSSILVYLIAADFFATALVDLFDYTLLRRMALPAGSLGIEIIASILFGVLFCLFPQFISHTAVTILAVVVICMGAMSFISAIYALYIDRTFNKYGINRNEAKSADVEYSEVEEN